MADKGIGRLGRAVPLRSDGGEQVEFYEGIYLSATGRRRVHLRLQLGGLALVSLLVACTACTQGKVKPGSSRSPSLVAPSPSAVPTDPSVAAVQNAVAAYRGMWQAYDKAIKVPEPNSPDLVRYATGNALQTLVSGLNSVKDRGLKGTGEVALSPQVTEVAPANTPTKVSIRDCFDDGGTHLVRASPGPPYNDTPGGRRLCLATVERQTDGTWKVTGFGLRSVGTC
jgi:hypothetical protein